MKQLVIRLQRKGRYKKPCYNVVVMFKKDRVQGATLDKIGFYNPMAENKMFFISLEKLA
jgi:small subunit ribosomal protein S16